MASKAFKLTLVRHGQTTHNKLKIIQGQLDTQLTDWGRDMAKLLRDYWQKNGTKFDKVYSSDLTRAYETCQIVCDGQYEIKKDPLLRERSFGVLQGSPLDMLRSEAYKAGHDENNFTQFRPEGGESMEEVQDRIQRFCKDELFPNAAESSRVLIVTHGGVVREFMKLFKKFGCPLSNTDMIITPNTSINEFEINLTPENRVQEVKVVQLHQIPHLQGDAKDEALFEDQLNDGSTKKKDEVEYAV
jgi:probable phosphoglycerate mutase